MKRQKSLQKISELMAQFVLEVESNNAMDLQDINRLSEDVLIPVYAEVYDYGNLVNLNTCGKNFPGIDLGDETAKVAFQITSDARSSKIKDTLEKFVKFEHYKRYNHLIVYVITKKQRSYAGTGWDKIIDGLFTFSKDDDIRDYRDLLREIRHLPIDKVQRAEAILKQHFIPTTERLKKQLSADLEDIQLGVFSHPYFPKALVDQKIEAEVDILRNKKRGHK